MFKLLYDDSMKRSLGGSGLPIFRNSHGRFFILQFNIRSVTQNNIPPDGRDMGNNGLVNNGYKFKI